LTQSNSTIRFLPKTEDDPRQRKPDITTAKNKIGWSPKVPVKVGLSKAIEYFRSELQETGEVIPTGPNAAAPRGGNK
jgi:UDP-glucuronate decarboxylase